MPQHSPDVPAVVTPIVHMNGNSYRSLMNALEKAYHAVDQAIEAVVDCHAETGNGRNFYPEPGRLQRYDAQRQQRLTLLQTVLKSLEAEAMQLDEETSPSLKRP